MQAILKRPRQSPRAHACWLPGTAGLGATGQCQPPASSFSLRDRTRAREELVSKTTPFLPEGNPRTWLKEDLGAPAGSSGSGGEQSPPPTGQGPLSHLPRGAPENGPPENDPHFTDTQNLCCQLQSPPYFLNRTI